MTSGGGECASKQTDQGDKRECVRPINSSLIAVRQIHKLLHVKEGAAQTDVRYTTGLVSCKKMLHDTLMHNSDMYVLGINSGAPQSDPRTFPPILFAGLIHLISNE